LHKDIKNKAREAIKIP
jgi:hypothetical protein